MAITMDELRKFKKTLLDKPHEPIKEMSPMKKSDIINHPPHYTATSIEPIDVIEAWGLGFHLGNCLKYLARCELKGRPLEDLEKARWYLDREIARRKEKHG